MSDSPKPTDTVSDGEPTSRALVSPWWMGTISDHVYEHCPARQRSLPELRRAGWDKQGRGELDLDGEEVCGWCRRVWLARNPAGHGSQDPHNSGEVPNG